MIRKQLCRIEQFLREHQDPRYRSAPWILPQRAWHGCGNGPLTVEQLAKINVRELGFDPKVVAGQPMNQMLHRIASAKSTFPRG